MTQLPLYSKITIWLCPQHCRRFSAIGSVVDRRENHVPWDFIQVSSCSKLNFAGQPDFQNILLRVRHWNNRIFWCINRSLETNFYLYILRLKSQLCMYSNSKQQKKKQNKRHEKTTETRTCSNRKTDWVLTEFRVQNLNAYKNYKTYQLA